MRYYDIWPVPATKLMLKATFNTLNKLFDVTRISNRNKQDMNMNRTLIDQNSAGYI